ncbi:MAG TPA: DUF4157 domain-containing protein [Vicingaceae bacterium]
MYKKKPKTPLSSNNTVLHRQTVQFKDNRPEATVQLKVQKMANQPIQRQANKTGMPDNLKSGIENLSGMDMSDVKVHYNSPQPAQLQAYAYAQGNQIHLGAGQEKHLPHEAWHVVQQKQGRVQPTKQLKGKVNINDDDALEREADLMGTKALQMKPENPGRNALKNITNSFDSKKPFQMQWGDSFQTGAFHPGSGFGPSTSHGRTGQGSMDKEASSASLDRRKQMGAKAMSSRKIFEDGMKRRMKRAEYERDRRREDLLTRRRTESGASGPDQVWDEWRQEILSKNPRIFDDGVYRDEWFLMPYSDILASESDRVMQTIDEMFRHAPSDSVGMRSMFSMENEHFKNMHPLVNELNCIEEHGRFAIHFNINPSYTKYLDGSGKKIALRIEGSSSGVGPSADYKTDVLLQPQTIALPVGVGTEVGYRMFARRLSQDHPKGMTSSKDSKQKDLMDSLANVAGSANTKYIKGHLLNDHLGGPARTENLFPITSKANGDHVSWVEKYVKAEIAAGFVLEYEVVVPNYTINPAPTPGKTTGYTIDSSFRCRTARIGVGGNKLNEYNITIQSQWSGAPNPLLNHNLATPVSNPSGVADLQNRLAPGETANLAKGNPTVLAPGHGYLTHNTGPGTYKQSEMASADHGDFALVSTSSPLPFSISGTKGKLSAALEPSIAKVIGKHKAKLVYYPMKGHHGPINKSYLLSLTGIGPKTVDELEAEFLIG